MSNKHFWAMVKNNTFSLACCGYFLANFWRKLGYFLLQHLVTLSKEDNARRSSSSSPS